MSDLNSRWLLLIVSLPTAGATVRMRLWRAIKAIGCVPLRDGAYLLPEREEHSAALEDLAEQTNTEGGQAWLVNVLPRVPEHAAAFHTLFDRSSEYAEFIDKLTHARKAISGQAPLEVARTVKRLRKDFDMLRRIDFFPNERLLAAEASWADFNEAANPVLSPGEPHPENRPISRLDTSEYQGRTWATRCNLWVDRVASAWLIQRFIDREATFVWLDTPAHCPTDALGFDFDGAVFTHVGDKVTFEVLLASFGLDQDAGLNKLGALVHSLDVGGPPNPEALGFEAILSGAKSRLPDDDALLAEIGKVLDSLHVHYSKKSAS